MRIISFLIVFSFMFSCNLATDSEESKDIVIDTEVIVVKQPKPKKIKSKIVVKKVAKVSTRKVVKIKIMKHVMYESNKQEHAQKIMDTVFIKEDIDLSIAEEGSSGVKSPSSAKPKQKKVVEYGISNLLDLTNHKDLEKYIKQGDEYNESK